jgi:hypothetical protein
MKTLVISKYVKKCLSFSVIGKCKSKKHRFHLSPVRMVIIRKTNKCWQRCRKGEEKGTLTCS